MAISAGPTGPFVLSLSKDRLRVFSLIEIANPRIEYGVAMTKAHTRDGALVVYNHQVHATPASVCMIFQRRALQVSDGSVNCDQLDAMMAAILERE